MATEREVLNIDGREVTISNPRKVYFPETGHTKLDLVNYYLAIAPRRAPGGRRAADGAEAVRRWRGRPAVLPEAGARRTRPEWMRTATLTFPSGRTADEIVIDHAAGLAWIVNLGCIDLNPHPVRAEDLDHPDELRVDLDPVPGVPGTQIRTGRPGNDAKRSRRSGWWAGQRHRGRAASTSTSGSSHAGRTRRCGARRSRWPATSSDASRISPPRNGGRRSGTASSSTTTRTQRTGPWLRPIPSGRCPMPVSRRRSAGTRSRPWRRRRSPSTRCLPGLPRSAIRATGSTTRSDRSTRCLT